MGVKKKKTENEKLWLELRFTDEQCAYEWDDSVKDAREWETGEFTSEIRDRATDWVDMWFKSADLVETYVSKAIHDKTVEYFSVNKFKD